MVDLLRRRGARAACSVPLDDEIEFLANAETEAGDAQRDLMKLLDRLPDGQRLPIQNMKLEGMSVEETARLTGMSASAVKVGVHHGLKMHAVFIKGEE